MVESIDMVELGIIRDSGIKFYERTFRPLPVAFTLSEGYRIIADLFDLPKSAIQVQYGIALRLDTGEWIEAPPIERVQREGSTLLLESYHVVAMAKRSFVAQILYRKWDCAIIRSNVYSCPITRDCGEDLFAAWRLMITELVGCKLTA